MEQTDKRFQRVHNDPRFIKAKKDAHKISLDNRFKHMLKDEDFASTAKVDKKGRKQSSKSPKELERFYKLESDEEIDAETDGKRLDMARGEGLESSDEDVEEEGIESDEEVEADQGPWADEVIPTGDETKRFACVNLDWDHVKAKDLYKVFDAFKPANGLIKSVGIYTSDFGKERMALEAVQGPPSTIFANTHENVKTDKGKDFNMAQLRKYQVDRLRYFYAVVECDSLHTSTTIFKACDGSEFESTSNFFDLRYVPDEMSFEDDPVDEASEAALVYEPVEFVTHALQHSNVKLTWDGEDPDRIKTTKRKFTKDDLKAMDFKAFLASDSDEEEDADPELKAKYQSLLAGSEEEDEEEELEITFAPGLSEKAAKRIEEIQEEKSRANETVFEATMRKSREKRKAKKLLKKSENAIEGSDEESEREDIINDPFFQDAYGSDFEEPSVPKKINKSTDKQKKKADREQLSKSKAELELLLMDDENNTKNDHFNAKDVIKAEKSKNRKLKKKQQEKLATLDTQDGFKMDLQDPRFAPLLEDHQFFIDPTNPQFKKTKTMKEILEIKRQKNEEKFNVSENATPKLSNDTAKSDLSSLVDSVKRKSVLALKKKGKRQRK
ncbi:pre-rRNA-processing protein esf1 [Globomyces sp. JEL0801]|nr:pre-rRNA-processing protein esf1 [Globomyces sp. JEL0801]